jgi:lipopolysaccharide transport system permease protein
MQAMIRSLWSYRHFIISSIRNEFLVRFARSKLGGIWMIINPLAQVAIYALILSNVLAAKLPGIESQYAYAIYLMAGLLAWSLFNEIVSRCLTLFIEHGNLLKKMCFPKIALPAVIVGSCSLNYIFLLSAMLGIFISLGYGFSLGIIWLLPLTLMIVAFALGLGLILAVINVFIRDVGLVVPILLQIWFWLTPIVYPESIIPDSYRHLLQFNPLYHIVTAYHEVLVYSKNPELGGLYIFTLLSFVLLALSLILFRRASEDIVDML